MSKPTRDEIQNGLNGWDAAVNDNFEKILDKPFPLYFHTGDESDIESTFPAASHENCLVAFSHTTLGDVVYMVDSEGTPAWKLAFIVGAGTSGLDYEETEQDTGILWIDDEPIYRKTIDLGTLPNSTTNTVPHGITGLGTCVRVYGFADNGTAQLPLPFSHPSTIGSQILIQINDTNVIVTTGSNRTDYTDNYVTLYYTKV